MTNKYFIILLGLLILLSGCAVNVQKTKITAFPKIYEQKPVSILILPSVNMSTAPEAKEYFMSTLTECANETGYYFLPLEVTTPFLQSEGLYDTEIISNEVLPQFKEYFGADAVLISKILKWDKVYVVVSGKVTVGLEFDLVSTTTLDTLWSYAGEITVNTTSNSSSLLVALIETAITTATQDYIPIAKMVNNKVFKNTPAGYLHPRYNIDGSDIVYIKKE